MTTTPPHLNGEEVLKRRRRALVSRDHETEMFLHRREIAVIVQQRMAMLDAEGTNDDVGRLANRDTQISEFAIVAGGARGKGGIQERHESISTQSAFDTRRMGLVPCALKDLEQDEIADQKRFAAGGGLQFGNGRGSMAAQVRDPDRAIDENHARRGGRPWRIASRSPFQPNPLRSASALACLRTRTSSRKPSSTVARLVDKPVAAMARDNNSSSISILVRIAMIREMCIWEP